MTTALDPTATPYIGPRTFSRAQSHLFFGREAEARDLLARVISERLLLFYAQSGAGKSSLLNARLIPQLEAEGFTVLPVGRVSGELPAGAGDVDNIFLSNLMLSLDQAEDAPARLAGLALSDFLAGLTTADGEHWTYDPGATAIHASQPAEPPPTEKLLPTAPPQRFVLIIDQFEEIIIAHPGRWQEREGFFRQLAAALQADPNQWIVLTLREDYVAALDPYAHLLPNRLRARFYMERMGVDAALEAIRRPAELGGRPFAPGVAEQLVDNLRLVRVPGQEAPIPGQYVEPVQLQVVCYQLWENLGKGTRGVAGTQITFDDLAEAGDVNRALTQFYEETLAAALADPAAAGVSERQLRTWFDEELITEAGTRGLVRQGEQNTGSLPNAVVRRLQERFLVHGETRSGDTWIELVHDRFIEPIRQSNRAWFDRNLNPLTMAARAWQDAGKNATKLYTGSQLVDATAQLAAHPADFGDLEQEFVAAGQEAQRQRAARRQEAIIRGAAALLILFASLTAWALWSRGQAQQAQRTAVREARAAATAEAVAITAKATAEAAKTEAEHLARALRAEQLTIIGLRELDENPPLALLLGVEGVNVQRALSETVAASALSNMHDLLRQAGGTPLARHENAVSAVTFSPDGRWLATASWDTTARLWEVANSTAALRVLAEHAGPIHAVAFSPDGRWLATASQGKTARLWEVASPAAEPRVLAGHAHVGSAVTFSPDGRWLATASDDKIARLWDLANPAAEPRVLAGHAGPVTAVAFSPDSRWLAASDDKTARLWEVANPAAEPRILAEGGLLAVAFSPDGRWLATASYDKTVRLWEVANPTAAPRVLAGHEGSVYAVAFSPDGHWLAAASADKTARLWEVANPAAAPRVLAGHTDAVYALAFSPAPPEGGTGGRWLATASRDKTARLWEVANPAAAPRVLARHTGPVSAVAFSPDGRWLATASWDKTARLWEVANPAAAPRVLAEQRWLVPAVAFSPDGRWLATASWDNTALLWEVANPAAAPRVLDGHEEAVQAVAFSPDGRWLATAINDETARLWEVANPAAAPIVLAGHAGPVYAVTQNVVYAVAFSPDGRWLTTTGGDTTARLWIWRVEDLIDLACATAGRNMSREEWQRYFADQPYRRTCEQWPEGK